MRDEEKTKKQLIEELLELRRRVIDLETLESEHKRIQKALRESEERFRFMAETTGDVLYRLRYNSMRYDYLSPSITKLRSEEHTSELQSQVYISRMPSSA